MIKETDILELIEKIKLLLDEVMEEEGGCNEGSLCLHYDKIILLLKCIEEKWRM